MIGRYLDEQVESFQSYFLSPSIFYKTFKASTTRVEQMFTAVKINDYKDKALKAGLTDDILADEEALVELLEKVGVPGGFAMKGNQIIQIWLHTLSLTALISARAWARRNSPKPEKAADGAAASAPRKEFLAKKMNDFRYFPLSSPLFSF